MELVEIIYKGGKIEDTLEGKLDKYSDLPVSTLIDLRRFKLATSLKLLGYSSIRDVEEVLDDSTGYLALGRIGKQLEDYINLGVYVHYEGREGNEDIIKVNIPEGMTREQLLDIARPIKDELAEDIKFIKEQDDKRERNRSIKPDYCKRMRTKMPDNEWFTYTKIVRETARLLLELNADLLGARGAKGKDSSKLTGLELAHRISNLIDSMDWTNAQHYENRAVIREGRKFIEEIDAMLDADAKIQESSVAKVLEEIKADETLIIKQIEENCSNYYDYMKYRDILNKTQDNKTDEEAR